MKGKLGRKMKDRQVDLCGRVDFQRDSTLPDLGREETFSFACRGCGDCCRGREDIVLSGYDLYRIARRLKLPPQLAAENFCRRYIGAESGLPVLRLAPRREAGRNCPFLFQNRCSIHDAKPLACALYPLGQEISAEGRVSYFLQPVDCGGKVQQERVCDYLSRYDIKAREPVDVLWAQRCMALEDRAETWAREFEPVLLRRLLQKLEQALYYNYSIDDGFAVQLEENLNWFEKELEKLAEFQSRRNSIKKIDG